MIILLIVAAIISGIIGEPEDTVVIAAIVVLNAIIGVVQEYRAERALQALKQLAALRAKVVRDGQPTAVPAAELVPGDVVLLEAGAIAAAEAPPASCRPETVAAGGLLRAMAGSAASRMRRTPLHRFPVAGLHQRHRDPRVHQVDRLMAHRAQEKLRHLP
jgi:hypothetical protein